MLTYTVTLHLQDGSDFSFILPSEEANNFLIFNPKMGGSKVVECYINDSVRPVHLNVLIETMSRFDWFISSKYTSDTIKAISIEYKILNKILNKH